MNKNKSSITLIKSKTGLFEFNFRELFSYFNLVFLFVKRDFSTRYKQTILGPAWLIISPACTVFAYSIIFGGIAGLSTDGVPKPLFYLAGVIVWNFFTGCVSEISNTFIGNTGLLGKIYFPRMVLPLSVGLTKLIDFLIQFALFFAIWIFYAMQGTNISIHKSILLLPLLMIQLMMLSLGVGTIITSVTTKYRDLMVLVGFGLQIWMYVTPVVYSVSLVPDKFMYLYMCNPVTPAILIFKHAFLGIGEIPWTQWGISWVVTLVFFAIGLALFNLTEKTFLDTV